MAVDLAALTEIINSYTYPHVDGEPIAEAVRDWLEDQEPGGLGDGAR